MFGRRDKKRLFDIYGFEVADDHTYRLQGKKYRLRKSGTQTLRFIATLIESMPESQGDRNWIIPFRDRIRDIERLDAREALTYVTQRTQSENVRCLAVWLRGRCGGQFGAELIGECRSDSNETIRKEVARSLKRMQAWSLLREIEATDASPRVCRMARSTEPRSHEDRVGDFLRDKPRLSVPRSRMELQISDECEFNSSRPPKSRWFIRLILLQIRRLVRGT